MIDQKFSSSTPEELAIAALSHIAQDQKLLDRFLAITGIEATHIRQAAAQPGFLAGVLQFIAAHEPTLLSFCEAESVPPQEILKAMRALPLGADHWDQST
ncbi:MAG: DUF3572 domain-containing protein [Rhizobiaceae bacterium]|nr:DUF3572 domain-containing protein [Rhizobiaceae bacterium]